MAKERAAKKTEKIADDKLFETTYRPSLFFSLAIRFDKNPFSGGDDKKVAGAAGGGQDEADAEKKKKASDDAAAKKQTGGVTPL